VAVAEDAVQDALVQAYDRLAQCRDPDNFAGWFFLILRNRCFGERRRQAREGMPLDDAAAGIATGGDSTAAVEREELRQALQAAVGTLTPEQREVFVLRHVEELSYEEIAARTGETVGALKMRMHRGYDRLRSLLKDHWR
jgi:RNA polymerase sigma-70 factor (ECF subfamily)